MIRLNLVLFVFDPHPDFFFKGLLLLCTEDHHFIPNTRRIPGCRWECIDLDVPDSWRQEQRIHPIGPRTFHRFLMVAPDTTLRGEVCASSDGLALHIRFPCKNAYSVPLERALLLAPGAQGKRDAWR